jgi:hypothetical protein
MTRTRERLEGRIDADQMNYLYYKADRHDTSRNEALRDALDANPDYQRVREAVDQGTETGKRYLREAAIARRTLTRK